VPPSVFLRRCQRSSRWVAVTQGTEEGGREDTAATAPSTEGTLLLLAMSSIMVDESLNLRFRSTKNESLLIVDVHASLCAWPWLGVSAP
jgi:hypothetical protein